MTSKEQVSVGALSNVKNQPAARRAAVGTAAKKSFRLVMVRIISQTATARSDASLGMVITQPEKTSHFCVFNHSSQVALPAMVGHPVATMSLGVDCRSAAAYIYIRTSSAPCVLGAQRATAVACALPLLSWPEVLSSFSVADCPVFLPDAAIWTTSVADDCLPISAGG